MSAITQRRGAIASYRSINTAPVTNSFTDVFTNSDNAAWNSAWVTAAGTTRIQSNQGAMLTGTGAYAQARADLSGRLQTTTTDVVVGFTFASSGEQYAAVEVCSDGTGNDGYNAYSSYSILFGLTSGQAQVIKRVNRTATTLATAGGLVFNANTRYNARVNITNNVLSYRVWQNGNPEPSTWTGSLTDTSLTTGWVSLGAMNGNDGVNRTILWDDLTVTATPATTDTGSGGGTGGGTTTPPATGTGTKQTTLYTIGDSETFGNQDGTGVTYPKALGTLMGNNPTVVNDGRGGWTSTELAILAGSVNVKVNGFTIPADQTEVTLTIQSPTQVYTQWAGWDGTINGIPGRLTHYLNTDGHWGFRRFNNGSATTVAAGSTFHGTEHDAHRGYFTVIMMGRNDIGNQSTVLSDIAATVANLTTPNYLVLSILTGQDEKSGTTGYNQVAAINAQLSATYGAHYVDVRSYLIKSGLAYNGLTANGQDNTNIAGDTVPSQLLWNGDNFHPNQYGYKAIAKAVYDKMVSLGYAGSSSGGSTTPSAIWGGKTQWFDSSLWAKAQIPSSGTDRTLIQKMITYPVVFWLTDSYAPPKMAQRVQSANAAGQIAVFSIYYIMRRDCGLYSAGGAQSEADYKSFIDQLVSNLGSSKAVFIIEPDGQTIISCLSQTEVDTRWRCIKYAVDRLSAQGSYTYIECGTYGYDVNTIASRLRSSGVANATGFCTNVSQFVEDEYALPWADQLSSVLGGKHYIVDTSRNGVPMIKTDGSTDWSWCNPPNKGLGRRPSTNTGRTNFDAALWVKVPGESDGSCNGAPGAGEWFQSYALQLARAARPAL